MERNRFEQISAAKLIPGMMAMFDLWSMPGLVLSNKLLNGQGERHISFLNPIVTGKQIGRAHV